MSRFVAEQSGATAIEYGLISIAIITAVRHIGTNQQLQFKQVSGNLT